MTTPCSGEHGCGAPIEWVIVAASGKRMPLDPEPVANGNIAFVAEGRVEVLSIAGGGLMEDRPLYVSHFATCPRPERFRKKNR